MPWCAVLSRGGGTALHGRCECSPGVHSSKIMVLSLFPDNILLFFFAILAALVIVKMSHTPGYSHMKVLLLNDSGQLRSIVSHVKLRLGIFCHHVSLYSHLHKCHLPFHYPATQSHNTLCISSQSALVANALINLMLSFFV